MRWTRGTPLLLGCAAALGLAAAERAGGTVPAIAPPAVRLTRALPNVVREGQLVVIAGRVGHAPAGTRVALELGRTGKWRAVARARLRGGGDFTLRWRVAKTTLTGPVSIRVAALRNALVLTATRPVQVGVGSAAVPCARPVPPAVDIPAGDGWIVGGRYAEGGPFPGVDACDGDSYTVTATSASGAVAATQQVAGLHSYTLVVPAGSYTLTSDTCRGTAIVTADKQTVANTYCLYP